MDTFHHAQAFRKCEVLSSILIVSSAAHALCQCATFNIVSLCRRIWSQGGFEAYGGVTGHQDLEVPHNLEDQLSVRVSDRCRHEKATNEYGAQDLVQGVQCLVGSMY